MTAYTTVISWHADGGYSGIHPANHIEFARRVEQEGHAITGAMRASGYRERCRAHDDALFCEGGSSMAAYYENGEAFRGDSWITDERLRRWLCDGRVA